MNLRFSSIVLLALTLEACSTSKPLPYTGATAGGAAGSGGAAGRGGAAGAAGRGGAAGATGFAGSGGSSSGSAGAAGEADSGGEADAGIPVNQVDFVECQPGALSATKVLDSSVTNPSFDVLGALGERLYALATDSLALLTFDADGANISSFVYGAISVAPTSSELYVLFDDTRQLSLQRYDFSMAPIGDPVELAPGPVRGASVAGGGDEALALWIGAAGLEGRLVSGARRVNVAIPESFALGARCESRAVAVQTGFNVAWACSGSRTTLSWARVQRDGKALQPSPLLNNATPLQLKAYARGTDSDLIMLNEASAGALIIASVDDAGNLRPPLTRYTGVVGFGLAARADGVGLIAATTDGRTVFRVVASDGSSKTAWQCLDGAMPGGYGAIMAAAHGYTALVRRGNGSAWLVSLDEAGNLERI